MNQLGVEGKGCKPGDTRFLKFPVFRGEDGLAGICDQDQALCFALALWNGRDPILKERLFGLGTFSIFGGAHVPSRMPFSPQ
jgi:hypothetical protein